MPARYISFRFDDGFFGGARAAAACLAPDYGTFFLVADLVTGGSLNHPEQLFRGRDFGTVAEWTEMAKAGQDIQLHGRSHRDMSLLSIEAQRREVLDSLAFTRRLHQGPFVFCHPFNRLTDLDFAALGISGAGFETRTSDQPIIFHRLTDPIDAFALTSWAVRERHFKSVVRQLGSLPDDSWTVLAFHSVGDEGHEPWTIEAFASLVATCRQLDMKIVSISSMIQFTQSSQLADIADPIRKTIPRNACWSNAAKSWEPLADWGGCADDGRSSVYADSPP